MARTFIRLTAAAGALGLGLMAVAPAVAATENQAGATALYLAVAGNGQDSGNVTATYADGKETKSGETQPAFPQPAQDAFQAGVLAQEATAKPGFSAACAGLAGDGGSVLNIGDSSCLEGGNALNGSLGNLNLGDLLSADPSTLPGYSELPASVKGPLDALIGDLGTGQEQFQTALTAALGPAITAAQAAQAEFGSGALSIDLDAIQGRCVVDDGGARGSSTLTNAKIVLSAGGQEIPIVNLPTNPAPNTHVVTDLSAVVELVVNAVKTSLTGTLGPQSGALGDALDQISTQITTAIRTQLEDNLQPVEDNLIKIVLNEQTRPTADSIKVRALRAEIGTAAPLREQVGASLVDLQIGTAACAPVARTAAVSPPQAAAPPKASGLPKAVSAGYATVPTAYASHDETPTRTIVLGAFALLVTLGAGLVTFRRLQD